MNRYERDAAAAFATPPARDLPLARALVSERVWMALRAARTLDSAPAPDPRWDEEERAAWLLYAPLLSRCGDRPFVFAQIGQSLDGRVATPEGDARDVSGRDGLTHLHRCRALADAVLIGVRTALADDPRLTVRLADGDCPARVIVDPSGRLDDGAKVFRDDGCRRIVVQACSRERRAGIEVIRLDRRGEGLDPVEIAAALGRLGFRRLLVEGGAVTIGRFLDAGMIDRLHVGIAPLIIGAGPSSLVTRPRATLAEATRPRMRVFSLGGDVVCDCAFAEQD